MADLKYKDGAQWKSIYGKELSNKLDKKENLSDVENVEEARNNLGLTGDNNHTHYHDDRYLPLIQKETADRIAADDAKKKDLDSKLEENKTILNNTVNNIQNSVADTINTAIQKEVNDRNAAIANEANQRQEKDKQLESSINNLNQSLSQEKQERKDADTNLQNQINKEIQDRTNADNTLSGNINSVSNKLNQEIKDRASADSAASADRQDIRNDLADAIKKQEESGKQLQNTIISSVSSQKVSGSTQTGSSISWDGDGITQSNGFTGKQRLTLQVKTGIGAGTYGLNDLLNKLVQMSHTHNTGSMAQNVVCNCNCNCRCNTHSH